MKFKFRTMGPKDSKCGSHKIGDVTYVPGDIIETDSDLAARFPSKFVRADELGNAAKSEKTKAKFERVASLPSLPMNDFGKDVSGNFKAPDGYAVYHDTTIKYTVVKLTENQIMRLGLKNPAAVEKFLDTLREVDVNEVVDGAVDEVIDGAADDDTTNDATLDS